MTIASVNAAGATSTSSGTKAKTSLSDLDQSDFLKLMMAQMQQQDPTQPQDNTQMLAQMAQFTSLAGTNDMKGTLSDIANKLGTLIASQQTTNATLSSIAGTTAA